jgi:hypothetical protein
MIHRIHPCMLLASFALALAACGGGGASGPPDKLSVAILDSIQRSCQKAFSCQSSYIASMHNGQAFADHYGGSNADACANSLKTLLLTFNGQDYFTKLDASVTAGRIKYNANDYDTCATAGEALTCDQFFVQNGATATLPAACDTASVGQVATAGACTLDDDCATAGDSCDAGAHTCG